MLQEENVHQKLLLMCENCVDTSKIDFLQQGLRAADFIEGWETWRRVQFSFVIPAFILRFEFTGCLRFSSPLSLGGDHATTLVVNASLMASQRQQLS